MSNNKLLSLIISMIVLVSCQSMGQPVDLSMIKLGDEINGLVITSGAREATPLSAFCSPVLMKESRIKLDCLVSPSARLGISSTFYVLSQAMGIRDLADTTWVFYLDGQSVALETFGTYDYVVPTLAPHPSPVREVFRQVKAWDVVLIVNPSPGSHTLSGTTDTGTGLYSWEVNLTVSE